MGCVEDPCGAYHVGCAFHRVPVPAAEVVQISQVAAVHDHEWVSHRLTVAELTCAPDRNAVSQLMNDRAVNEPPSSE